MSTGVTENQANIRSWLRHHQDPQFPISAAFVKYFAQQLDPAGVMAQQLFDLRLSVFDPQQHIHIDDETLKTYYVLTAQLSDRQIPPQTRAAPALNIAEVVHLQFVHASSMGGIVRILQNCLVAPSRLHFESSQSFFRLAAKPTSDIRWDRTERLIHDAWKSSRTPPTSWCLVLLGERVKLYIQVVKKRVCNRPCIMVRSIIRMDACG